MSPKKSVAKSSGKSSSLSKKLEGFTAEEKSAMKDRVKEIKAAAPMLTPRLWYGMPAYSKDDKVLCFFQSGQKFRTRYATLGFSDKSNLDEIGRASCRERV